MTFDFVPVAAIVVICYLIGMICKAWQAFDDRKIPVVVGLCGAVLGGIAFLFLPGVVPAGDLLTAIAIGIVSGLSATGANQIAKQAGKEA